MLEELKHSLVNYVETQGSFDQELSTILHHFGAYSSPEHAITDPDGLVKPRVYNLAHEAIPSASKYNSTLYNWVDIPSSLAVTVQIPRHALVALRTIMMSLETGLHILEPETTVGGRGRRTIKPAYVPALQACIRPTHDHEGKPVANMPGHLFTSLQTGFGELEIKGRHFTPRFRLNIETDPLGWEGQSDLFVSFMVPTSILMRDAVTGLVTVEVVPTIGPDVAQRSELSFLATGTLKMDLKIFEANLGFDPSEPVPSALKTMMTAKMDDNHQRISSISTRITLLTDRLLDRLANRECKVRSVAVTPCSYHLIISKDPTASFFSHGPKSSHFASPEDEDKQLKEKDKQLTDALNRYLNTAGEHSSCEKDPNQPHKVSSGLRSGSNGGSNWHSLNTVHERTRNTASETSLDFSFGYGFNWHWLDSSSDSS
ncbi:hypothetical protein N0V85_004653 [Neurospora sp. IMI 360204]|nr:hypothetical protein N0V85_004653 [Neurospora sp. IMI 360204]